MMVSGQSTCHRAPVEIEGSDERGYVPLTRAVSPVVASGNTMHGERGTGASPWWCCGRRRQGLHDCQGRRRQPIPLRTPGGRHLAAEQRWGCGVTTAQNVARSGRCRLHDWAGHDARLAV